jgi:hypothetical protein
MACILPGTISRNSQHSVPKQRFFSASRDDRRHPLDWCRRCRAAFTQDHFRFSEYVLLLERTTITLINTSRRIAIPESTRDTFSRKGQTHPTRIQVGRPNVLAQSLARGLTSSSLSSLARTQATIPSARRAKPDKLCQEQTKRRMSCHRRVDVSNRYWASAASCSLTLLLFCMSLKGSSAGRQCNMRVPAPTIQLGQA